MSLGAILVTLMAIACCAAAIIVTAVAVYIKDL